MTGFIKHCTQTCLRPSHCPSTFVIKPFGKSTLWNFTPCTLVWLLYTTHSFKAGLQIRTIVPSTSHTSYYKGAPFPAAASVYFCKYCGCKKLKLYDSSVWWWRWSIKSNANKKAIKGSSVKFRPKFRPTVRIGKSFLQKYV